MHRYQYHPRRVDDSLHRNLVELSLPGAGTGARRFKDMHAAWLHTWGEQLLLPGNMSQWLHDGVLES
jgi:hypothetical protein